MQDRRYCPGCNAPCSPAARYCEQCGRFLGSAGLPTQRLALPVRWVRLDGYAVCVHAMKDEMSLEPGEDPQRVVRSVRFNVEYVNESDTALPHACRQWLLYDREGYSYEFEIRTRFFGDDAERKLQEGIITPGKRVRGWIAFAPAEHALVSYLQFRRDYGSTRVTEIPVEPIDNAPSGA